MSFTQAPPDMWSCLNSIISTFTYLYKRLVRGFCSYKSTWLDEICKKTPNGRLLQTFEYVAIYWINCVLRLQNKTLPCSATSPFTSLYAFATSLHIHLINYF